MVTSATPPPVRGVRAMFIILFSVSSAFVVGSTPVNAQSYECVHGQIGSDNACVCDNCWSGARCDQYASQRPFFLRRKEEVTLNPYRENDKPIFTAQAVDADEKGTCPSKDNCPCGEIHYAFGSGNENGHFNIDSITGEVMVSRDFLPINRVNSIPMEDTYKLQILASNPGSDLYDQMELQVHNEPSWSEQVPNRYLDHNGEGFVASAQHHIHKRSPISLPDNVTFTLTKTGNSENMTEMRVGSRISFQLQILFPETTTDMLVELFAPDNDSIVMMLCDVKVFKIGQNLDHTGAGNIVMDSQNSSNKFFDRAIIDFGNVTNTFALQDSEGDSSIYITWDAVMIQNDDTQNNAIYWVSAGAEYNYEMEVWVGQASFTAKTDAEPGTFSNPPLNLTGPDVMQIGTSAIFTLDIFLTQPSTVLNIDAFAPFNHTDVMSICDMQVVDTGPNYDCGFVAEEHKASLFADSNTRGYDRARLELGTVTNKGVREPGNPMENNRITVQFVVHMYDDESYIGQSYWIGAAVEIGTDRIWAGELLITGAALNTATNIVPTWNLIKEGTGKVSTVNPLLFTLEITVPQHTAGKYALEILAPFSGSAAILQLCSISVLDFGKNLICTKKDIAPIYTSRGDPVYTDRGLADFGTIANVGPWGWQPYNLTDNNVTVPDVLRVRFMLRATNHSMAVVGSSHEVTMGFVINDKRLDLTRFNVEVEAAPEVANITDETMPDWNLTWVSGDGNITVGGAGQFLVSIITKRNTIYAPFDLEALMPNSTGSTQVAVCKLNVHSVGANLPCLLPSAVNNSVTYTSFLEDGLSDRAVLNLPSVCNYELVNDTTEDILTLKVGFKLQPDSGLTNNEELWPSVGVMFSPYKMWVGQIKALAITSVPFSTDPPHVVLIRTSPLSVPVGYLAFYNLRIKTPPGFFMPLTANVSVSMPGLSVCSVKVIQVGDNIPCVNASAVEAAYERNSDGANVKGSLDFGVVTNTGLDSLVLNDYVDENTIVVEVAIGVTSDTTIMSDGTSCSFQVQVFYDADNKVLTVEPFTVIHDQSSINMTANDMAKIEFFVAPITEKDNDTNVIIGQSKRFFLCARTYPGSITKLSAKMMTRLDNSGKMEVNYIGMASVGKNVPCAGSCNAGLKTYEARSGSETMDIATLDFGYLLNNNFDTQDSEANKVCFEGIFRVLKDDSLTAGTTLVVASTVNVNNVDISSKELTLNVISNSTFADIYLDNGTVINGSIISINSSLVQPLCLTPSDVQTFPLLLSVPAMVTSVVNMDMRLQLDQSACMTYKDIRLKGVGKNLKGFGKDYDLQCTPKSTKGTTQMDTLDCNFGVVTNPGTSHRCEEVLDDDDVMYVEVDIQMADCLAAEKDAEIDLSFGYKVAGFISILNCSVTVCRDGSETPVFNITADANSTGSTVYVSYDLRLDNISTAELHNSTLVLMPPPYITCELATHSGANQQPAVTASANKVVIELGSVYFTDAISLVVRCQPTSSYTVPMGISGYHTVLKHQMYGDVIQRTGSLLSSQTVWSDIGYVNFTATTVSESGLSCTPVALNMQDSNVIFDCQITGSPASITDATKGRKSGSGWTPFVRDGELSQQRYFQVFFANKMQITFVEIFQSGPAMATEIKLAYSNDGKSFMDGDTISIAGSPSEKVQVPRPKDSRVLRVYITKDNNSGQKLSLTFELYGCEVSTGGPTGSAAVCAAATTAVPTHTPNSLFFRRSFLTVSPDSVFVCDGIVKKKGISQRCFVSPDGSSWQGLDPRVASMVGYEPETNRVFALADDGVTFMSSGDNGQTWASTHSDAVNKAKSNAQYVAAMDVPWTDRNILPAGNPAANYQMGSWGASYDYLKKNEGTWSDKLKWDCC